VLLEYKAFKADKVFKVSLVDKELKEPLVLLVLLVLLEYKGFKADKEHKEQLEPKERKEP
jgi:hypothetical protein